MALIDRLRVRWRRLRWGIDDADRVPGQESVHLRGRALRKAVREGRVNPDGSSRTIRRPPGAPSDS